MSDQDYLDSPLGKKFLADLDYETLSQNWPTDHITPPEDTDFMKGVRYGIGEALATIRQEITGLGVWRDRETGGQYVLSHAILSDRMDPPQEGLEFFDDLERVLLDYIPVIENDDIAVRAYSTFLRKVADEVDKALRNP